MRKIIKQYYEAKNIDDKLEILKEENIRRANRANYLFLLKFITFKYEDYYYIAIISFRDNGIKSFVDVITLDRIEQRIVDIYQLES